jgi:hypothetical protein
MADRLAEAGASFPLAAELYEVAVNESNAESELSGIVVKVIILISSKMDPARSDLKV